MPNCLVCKARSGKDSSVSLFCFPRNDQQRSAWISRLRLKNSDALPSSRICSDHFESDCFEEVPSIRLELQGKPRCPRKLKLGALPKIHSPTKQIQRRTTGQWRKARDELWMRQSYIRQVEESLGSSQCNDGASTSASDGQLQLPGLESAQCNDGVSTFLSNGQLQLPGLESSQCNDGVTTSLSDGQLQLPVCDIPPLSPCLSPIRETDEPRQRTIGTQWDPADFTDSGEEALDIELDSRLPPLYSSSPRKADYAECIAESNTAGDSDAESVQDNDTSFSPSFTEDVTGEFSFADEDCQNATEQSSHEESKSIIFQSCLVSLFRLIRCPTCPSVIVLHKNFITGSLLTVNYTCLNGHLNQWCSQPKVNEIAGGNLLLPAAILFSGLTFAKFQHVANIFKLKIMSESEFYKVQSHILFPVVDAAWKQNRDEVEVMFADQTITLCGDGRCDSPGHNAKYGTYSLMEDTTGLIVDFELVQIGEAAVTDDGTARDEVKKISYSQNLEKEGLIRSLHYVQSGLIGRVGVLATDRHPQIKSYMSRKQPHIDHQFDVWHFAKTIMKKLSDFAKTSKGAPLQQWIPAINNHLWWSAATCKEDADLLREKWRSILQHIRNVHQWAGGKYFLQCEHPPLTQSEQGIWLFPGSPSFEKLKSVVLDKKLLRDIGQLCRFCHTGNLEVFHSMLLKYCPKRQHFSYNGMLARTQLAALDNNKNASRMLAIAKEGKERHKVDWSKRRHAWFVKEIRESKDYSYVDDIMSDVVIRRESLSAPNHPAMRSWRARKQSTSLPANIASEPKPQIADAVRCHRTRLRVTHNQEDDISTIDADT